MRKLRYIGPTVAMLGAASSLFIGTSAQAAMAAPGTPAALATAGQYCGTYESGTTQEIFTKQPPGCYDVNIVWADAYNSTYDDYAGNYWNGSTWVEGSAGYQYIADGNCDPITNSHCVPLTNVATGTNIYIAGKINHIGDALDSIHLNL